MKILIIMGGFFPGKKFGGPPVSVDNFCSLMEGHECFVVTTNHDMGEKTPYAGIAPDTWLDRGNCKICYLEDKDYCKAKFDRIIQEIKPDVLYLQGLFQKCVLPCLMLAKKHQLGVVLAPRGELCAGAMRKKYKKLPYIALLRCLGLLKNVRYQSTSDEETQGIQKYLGAQPDRIHFMTNIPSIPKTEYPARDKQAGEVKLIFLSRIVSKKNLHYALDCLKAVKERVTFHIYGSIEDPQYWAQCQEQIGKLPDNIQAAYKGLLSHDQVHETFAGYDGFLFPTKSENYGHVIAESLIVGTPVIISDQTPWLDMEDHDAGWALPLDAPEAFTEKVSQLAKLSAEQMLQKRANTLCYARKATNLEQLRRDYSDCLNN